MSALRSGMLLMAFLCLLPAAVAGVVLESGDQVVIDTAVEDDLFASGGEVLVNAPVESLTAAGGRIVINAPVSGDVILAGGTLEIHSDIGGKVIAAGGEIDISGTIGRNIIVTGGSVTIREGAVIGRDALITADTVRNEGTVEGLLTVSAERFDNTGSAGEVLYDQRGQDRDGGIGLPVLLVSLGFIILGLVWIRFLPGSFFSVTDAIQNDPLKSGLYGIFVLVVGIISGILLAITIIGLPMAFLITVALMVGILLSSLFVGSALGTVILTRLKTETGPMPAFILGFVILHILFALPIIGLLVRFAAVLLGLGAVAVVIRKQHGEQTPTTA